MSSANGSRLLEKYTLVDTRSPEEARKRLGQLFCPHFLTAGREGEFHAILRSFRHQGISLNFIGYGCSVDIDPGLLADFFLLHFPVSGYGNVRCGSETAHVREGETASILSPTLPAHMHWSADCYKIAVRIDRHLMLQRFEAITGRRVEKVEFETALDLKNVAGRLLMDHLKLMIETAESGGAPIGNYLARLGEGMADLLLTAFNHSARAMLEHQFADDEIRVVVRARDWVQANVADSFSAADIARAAGASLRSLQEVIRRQKGMKLTELVETIRLEHFRARLVDPDENTTVTDAAIASGFGHMGRAAMAYRKRYGETPKGTLRRNRWAKAG